MSDKPTLSAPNLSVSLEDGTTFEVQATNRDLVAYEREAARRKWPAPTDAPFTWLTFLAWSAARRESLIDNAMTLSLFTDAAVDVSKVDDDDEDDEIRPTPRAHDLD